MAVSGNFIEVIGLSTAVDNPIYYGSAGCCGIVNLKIRILPIDVFPLMPFTLKVVTWTDGCSSYAPTMVNGQPWANPLTTPVIMNPGDVVDIQLAICSCVGVGNTFAGQLYLEGDDATATTYNQTTNYTFIEHNIASLPPFTDTYVNHYPCDGDPSCPPRPGYIYFTNPTVADVWVGVIMGAGPLCRVDGVVVPTYTAPGLGTSFLAKAGQTYEIESYQCPTAGAVSWCIDFEICGDLWSSTYGCCLIIDTPVTCGPCDLACVSLEIQDADSILGSTSGSCPSMGGYVAERAIGEELKLQWTVQYANNFFGGDIDFYFNPWLYGDVCNFASKYGSGIIDSPPPVAFHFRIQPSHVADGLCHDMTLIGAGINALNQKNFTATICVSTDMTAVINFKWFVIADIDNWLDSSVVPNQPKLLNNHISAPVPLVNTVMSAFNTNKNICLLAYIKDPKTEVPSVGDPSIMVPYECHLISNIGFTARFYNDGITGGPAEMTNPEFEFERNGVIVPGLSSYAKTKVTFRITYGPPPSTAQITHCYFWLIDANQFNDFVDFPDNYDSSRALITTIPGVTVLDNKLQSPSVGPTHIGGGTYEMSAYIGGGILGGGQYYIIAVPYAQDEPMVNSFISGPIPVTPVPGIEGCCPPDLSQNIWWDYYNSYSGCFTPTMKERIRNTLLIEPGDFGTCLENWGWDPMDFDWFNFMKSVTLNIYRRVTNYPTPLQNTYFVFDSFKSIRDTAVSGNWINPRPDEFLVEESAGVKLDLMWNGRVRYESNIPVPPSNVFVAGVSTPMNRVPAGGAAPAYITANNANFDWANTDIYFEYVVEFDLSFLFGGNPCVFNQVFINRIKPIDFETTPNPYGQLFEPLLVEGVKGVTKTEITGQFCPNDYDYLLVTMESLAAMDGRVYAFLDPYPYGVANLIEKDPTTSPSGFTQLGLALGYIYAQDATHVGTKSEWKLDINSIPPGKYQLCTLFLDKKP